MVMVLVAALVVWFMLPPITPPQRGGHPVRVDRPRSRARRTVSTRTSVTRTPARRPTPRRWSSRRATSPRPLPSSRQRRPGRPTGHDRHRARCHRRRAVTAAEDSGDRRRPGRPRSVDADRAIVQATLEMLADEGYHALSVEAVASRAGVGKATIYRRWAGKRELVADALATLNDTMQELPPPAPDARSRPQCSWSTSAARTRSRCPAGSCRAMMAYRMSHPELFDDYVQRVVEPRRERMRRSCVRGSSAATYALTSTWSWRRWRSPHR